MPDRRFIAEPYQQTSQAVIAPPVTEGLPAPPNSRAVSIIVREERCAVYQALNGVGVARTTEITKVGAGEVLVDIPGFTVRPAHLCLAAVKFPHLFFRFLAAAFESADV
jgi:hypothetical protein